MLLLVGNFSFLSFPNKADAFWGIGDITFDPAEVAATIKDTAWSMLQDAGKKALAAAYRYAVRELIQKITESTVEWINNGFEGQPAFISNPGKFLTDIGDNIVGDMIAGGPLNFLCSPFQLEVKLALGLGGSSTFTKRIGCTLSNVVNNVQNAKVGASASLTISRKTNTVATNIQQRSDVAKSWNDFADIINNPQDTPTGAYLIAATELANQIADKQNAASQELNQNSGALTYKKCTETTYDASGNQVSQRTYSGSDFINVKGSATLNGNAITNSSTKKTSCKTTTPGRVITDLVTSKANEDGHINEMQAALGDGLDQIFNALVNQLLTKLQNGLLGDNSAVNDQQTADRIAYANQATLQYNSSVAAAANYASTDGNGGPVGLAGVYQPLNMNQFNSFFGPTYSQNYASAADLSATTQSQTEIGASFDNLAKPRGDAIARLYSLNDAELNYQNTYTTATDILTQARAVFASSSVCNAKFTDPNSQLRAQIINANVITNIDGIPNSARDVASIPWNLQAIQALMDVSNQHIDILATAQNAVLAVPTDAQNTQAITDAMIPVNSTSFNLDPQTATVGYIKTWLTSMQTKYTTPQCPINLGPILAITIPTFQPTTPPVIVAEGVGVPTSLANPTGTVANPNPLSGPFISSITPATVRLGDPITIKGGQLLYAPTGNTTDQNSLFIDGVQVATGLSGATIQGLALKPFIIPSSTTLGTHSISVKNRLGTTNAMSINVIRALIYTCHPSSFTSHTQCFLGGWCHEVFDSYTAAYCAWE